MIPRQPSSVKSPKLDCLVATAAPVAHRRPRRARRLLVALAGLLVSSTSLWAQVPSQPGDWPQWRGPNRDGISVEKNLLKEWPKDGPAVVWQVDDVGVGYSSLAVHGNRIYTMGDLEGIEHVIAIDLKTGRRLWAAQPAPVARLLTDKVEREFKRLDRDQDGTVDEVEALAQFGWNFNQFDKDAPGDAEARLKGRAAALLKKLDANQDGKLSYAEAGNTLRDRFERADQEDKNVDASQLAKARAAELMKLADKDQDGKVTRQEARGNDLDRLFGRVDLRDPATNKGDDLITATELEQYFQKSEPGRDGLVTAEELTNYYLREKPTGDGRLTVAEVRFYYGGFRNDMGHGPRGTPTIDGERLYVEGGFGDVACLNTSDGSTIWHVSLTNDFGGGVPGWGYSESPLIVGDLVIVTPGGKKGTVLALNKMTGAKVWQSEEVQEGAHYSSPVVAEIAGTRQIVQFGNQSVFGVSLQGGKLLWNYKAPANGTANCCAPIVEDDLVFASSSYGVGGGLARITGGGTDQKAEEVYFDKKMACHHGGIVKIGDYMYSNGAGPLICMNFKTGKIAWQHRSVGKGSLVAADGMLYVLSEGHEVALVEANPEEYREHGRFKIKSHGRPSWAHPVVAQGKLLLRDQEELTVYELKAK
ncbi:MAG: PQQ-binding-like beta-propeller repeat protein [Planctomycetota bacterium]